MKKTIIIGISPIILILLVALSLQHFRHLSGPETEAQCRLGYQYEHGLGVPVNYPEAIKCYRLAADAGNNDGRCALGWMYEHGEGKQDYQEAIKWYRLAADAGDNAGRNAMGWMYEQGLGIHRDLAEAARWYRLAADAGDDRGRENQARVLLEAKTAISDGRSKMSVTNGGMPN